MRNSVPITLLTDSINSSIQRSSTIRPLTRRSRKDNHRSIQSPRIKITFRHSHRYPLKLKLPGMIRFLNSPHLRLIRRQLSIRPKRRTNRRPSRTKRLIRIYRRHFTHAKMLSLRDRFTTIPMRHLICLTSQHNDNQVIIRLTRTFAPIKPRLINRSVVRNLNKRQ